MFSKEDSLAVVMASLGTTTILMGAVLLNPYVDTFRSSPSWVALNGIRIWFIQPDETMWGGLFFVIGVLQLSRLRVFKAARKSNADELRHLAFVNVRITYVLAAMLWVGVGASWFISNPFGTGLFLVLPLPFFLSIYVAWAIGVVAERLEGEGGP
jgi:hypothetical protein